jgi:hypothetical protein
MKPMLVTMIRLKQPSIQSIFTRNERCGDCRTLPWLALSRWRGQLTWLDQVAATLTTFGTNCKAPSHSNLHRTMGYSSLNKHGDWFLQKMAALKVKAILEQDVLLETSAHCIRCLAGSVFQDLRR